MVFFEFFAASRQLPFLEKIFFGPKFALRKKSRLQKYDSENQTTTWGNQNQQLRRKTLRQLKLGENNSVNWNHANTIPNNFAERLSSAMNALGAECAARSTIRDKRVHSL
jgi:hypothetical protein